MFLTEVIDKSETHILYPKYFLRKPPGFDTHKHTDNIRISPKCHTE